MEARAIDQNPANQNPRHEPATQTKVAQVNTQNLDSDKNDLRTKELISKMEILKEQYKLISMTFSKYKLELEDLENKNSMLEYEIKSRLVKSSNKLNLAN